MKNPEKLDVVIFRENTEDIYAGVEWEAESPEAKKVIKFLLEEMKVTKIRFPDTSGIGIKPISREGSERLIRAAIDYAIAHKRKSVTLVHKGNIMKFTEGAFRDWGYELTQARVQGQGGRMGRLQRQAARRDRSWSMTTSPTSRCSRC